MQEAIATLRSTLMPIRTPARHACASATPCHEITGGVELKGAGAGARAHSLGSTARISHKRAGFHSTLKPEAFTTGAQRAISSSINNLAFSESESGIASRPWAISTF